MAKAFPLLLTIAVLSIAAWQYVRITQYEKDVYFHHAEDCKLFNPGTRVVDLCRMGDVNLALSGDVGTTQSPFLLYIRNLAQGKPVARPAQISGLPSGPIKPLGFHLRQNSTLFVLSQPNDTAEVLSISLYEDGPEVIKGKFNGKFSLPRELAGTVTDLIAAEDGEVYLAQTYAVPGDDAVSKAKQLAHELLDLQATAVHHCTFAFGEEAKCRPLEDTRAVSVTGIAMDKFGAYFVAYASVDTNWVGVYERKENGDLILQQKVPLRDRAQKLDYDILQQRGYCGGLPYPYAGTDGAVPGGAVEITTWDHRAYHTHRTLLMHDGTQFKGGSCVTRQGQFLIMASVLDENLLLCPMFSPFI